MIGLQGLNSRSAEGKRERGKLRFFRVFLIKIAPIARPGFVFFFCLLTASVCVKERLYLPFLKK